MLVAIVGCASDSGSERASIATLKERYSASENLDRWSLPMDSYHGLDATGLQYAVNIATRACMAKQGFDLPIPAPAAEGGSLTESPFGRKLFNAEVAEKYGYGGPPPTQDQKDAVAVNSRRPGPAELKALTGQTDPDVGFDDGPRGCVGAVSKKIGSPNEDLLDSLENAAYQKAQLETHVATARKAWRTCVDATGITGLPDRPEDMPGSLRTTFGLGAGDGTEPREVPSKAEIALATADAACRESSKYTDTLYRVEFEAQLRSLEANDEELSRARQHNEAIATRAKKLIAKSAGN